MDGDSDQPVRRFRDRKTRKLTRKLQESLDHGENSSSIGMSSPKSFSSPRARKAVDADNAVREGFVEQDGNMNIREGEDTGYVTEEDLPYAELSQAWVESPSPRSPNDSSQANGKKPASELLVGPNVSRVLKRSYQDYEDLVLPEFSKLPPPADEDPYGVRPCPNARYHKKGILCILCFPAGVASMSGEQYYFEMGQSEDKQDASRSSPGLLAPEPNSHDSVWDFADGMIRSTQIQAPITRSPSSRLLGADQTLLDDPFMNSTPINRMSSGPLDGRGGMNITLANLPYSPLNSTTNPFDLDRSWKDATKDVQLPSLVPIGRTHDENIDEAWQRQLNTYHLRMGPLHVHGGNPTWEQWRREGDPAWDLDSVHDELVEQGNDPVPFVNPFARFRDGQAEGLSLPNTPTRSNILGAVSYRYSNDEDANESQEMRLRGGGLPEPHGEMGLDANDLAAVESFVKDNPREDYFDSFEPVTPTPKGIRHKQPVNKKPKGGKPNGGKPTGPTTNGIQHEQPVTEEPKGGKPKGGKPNDGKPNDGNPNGASVSKQPVQQSGPSSQSQQGEKRIEDGGPEFVTVSRHLSVGKCTECWRVGMEDLGTCNIIEEEGEEGEYVLDVWVPLRGHHY